IWWRFWERWTAIRSSKSPSCPNSSASLARFFAARGAARVAHLGCRALLILYELATPAHHNAAFLGGACSSALHPGVASVALFCNRHVAVELALSLATRRPQAAIQRLHPAVPTLQQLLARHPTRLAAGLFAGIADFGQ